MTCEQTKQIQAYLDGELTREQRKEYARHLDRCSECRNALSEAKRLSEWTDVMLAETFDTQPEKQVQIDVDAAWARFEANIVGKQKQQVHPLPEQENRQEPPDDGKLPKRSWLKMAKAYKKWVAGTAAAVVVVSALTVPKVQAAGVELLSMFRVDHLQTVKLSDQDIRQLENWVQSGQNGEKELGGFGKIWVNNGDGGASNQVYRTAAQAQQAGLHVPELPGTDVQNIYETKNFELTLQLDTDKANRMLTEIGANAQFDSKLNGQKFTIGVPESLHIAYSMPNENGLNFEQFAQPKLQAPPGVDLRELRSTVLKLPFLPQDLTRQLTSMDDWQTTLPIPVQEGRQTSKNVTVGGVSGILVENIDHSNISVFWQKDGKVNTLSSWSNPNHPQTMSEDKLLQLASQMK